MHLMHHVAYKQIDLWYWFKEGLRRPFFTFSSPGPNSTSRHYQNFSKRPTFSNNHLSEAGGNVTLVNRGEQICATCITLLINRLIRAIGLKRVFNTLLSHSPHPARPFSLGITRISRKGRLFPTIFGPKKNCELCQHFGRQIATPPLSSQYIMITPVAGLIFKTKNRAIFLERFFGREIAAREQLSRAVILARF